MRRIGMAVRILLVIALFGLPAGVQAQSDDGLVAEWHFDEGSGSVLKDSSGNGNDGVIHGATWVNGISGKALYLDGVNDFIEVPNSPSLCITDAITVELWINPTTVSDNQFLVCKRVGYRDVYRLSFASDSITIFVTELCPLERLPTPHSSNPVSIDQWAHIVATYDGTEKKLYINGVEDDSVSASGSLCVGPGDLYIGCNDKYAPVDNRWFNGIVDEVRIYNRALTADEIKSHYEGQQTALSLTKSAAPHSIKQGQTSTVTLAVKNTGTTEITDIEVSDTIPSDPILVSGETSKTYASLRPKDSREFQYTIQLNEAGTFNLDPATATYSDEEGNYHATESETTAITVILSTDQPATPHPTKNPSADISTASVHLHGEKTDVVMGEDILLKLSAVNKITKPTMTLQVILIPPSGMSVTSADFVKSGAGLYTSTYVIEPGIGRDIEVGIRSNQVGEFVVNGEVIYYFGDDKENAEEHLLSLPITVRASPIHTPTPAPTPKPSPGFGSAFAAAGLLLVALLIKRRRVD